MVLDVGGQKGKPLSTPDTPFRWRPVTPLVSLCSVSFIALLEKSRDMGLACIQEEARACPAHAFSLLGCQQIAAGLDCSRTRGKVGSRGGKKAVRARSLVTRGLSLTHSLDLG